MSTNLKLFLFCFLFVVVVCFLFVCFCLFCFVCVRAACVHACLPACLPACFVFVWSRERKAESDSSSYQPNAVPLGQAGSLQHRTNNVDVFVVVVFQVC